MGEWSTWIQSSNFSVLWFDLLLGGVVVLQLLALFLRKAAVRTVLTCLSVLSQLGLIFACVFLKATLTECLLTLAICALISCFFAMLEYRLYDRPTVEAECAEAAARAKEVAKEREELFVSPLWGEKAKKPAPAPDPEPEPVPEPAPSPAPPTTSSRHTPRGVSPRHGAMRRPLPK